MLTHHTPSLKGSSAPAYEGSTLSHAFSTNLQHLMGGNVALWACGHTHYTFDMVIKGSNIVSNQLGYVMNILTTKFKPLKCWSVSEIPDEQFDDEKQDEVLKFKAISCSE